MPASLGVMAGGVDIEPFTTIKSFNPLCYWRMDEASGSLVNSGSTASRNITATNLSYNQTKVPTRSPKGSISFNGTTNTAETTAGVIGGVNPTFSIGCWIRTTTASGTANLISQRDGTNGNSGFDFYISSGAYLGFQGRNNTGLNDFSFLSEQISDINDGNNHYVGATVASDNVFLYLDGALVGEYGGRSGGTWSAIPKIFLGQQSGPTNRYTGNMSDAFITTQVLSQNDHNKIWRVGMLHNPTPPNDNFLDAVEITFPTTETTITGLDLSDNSIELNEIGVLSQYDIYEGYNPRVNSAKTAWYKFVSPDAGKRIKVAGYGQTPYFSYHYLELYKDTDGTMANLELVQQNLSYLTNLFTYTEADSTYYLRVRPKDFFPNVLDLTYSYVTPPAPPANDDFADAITIDVTSAGSIAGTTDGASIEFPLETDYWDSGLFTSVWYKFTANATGSITLTDTSGNDSIIVLFENVNNIAEVETVVNTTGAFDGDQPALTTAVTSGNTYHVQISDYANGQAFTLAWTVIT